MNINFFRRLGARPESTLRAPHAARRVALSARRSEDFRLAGR
ncbi:hypothetical protein Lfu02_08010 [Longispora fulva]|uniref:Uncharacterized protein n=1 Tax=Longispora fulva TaxID=619741 RepID=A0A8J7G7V6_9ACTN|nr:hypothetical protein [Longispora fulva]MBG6135333.1 hypothetical protein [Longispora fulva]GIG56429.1 hypothetical protein Lfu02_08010 [Longispora fulva]